MTKPALLSKLLCLSFACLLSAALHAQIVSTSQAELLYSDSYKARAEPDEGIFSFKNSTSFSKGDSFLFADFQNIGNYRNAGSFYGEWTPRLSLGKTFGDGPSSAGLVRDVFVVGELNYVYNQVFTNVIRLGGVGVDLNVPGFAFLKVHLFYRDDARQQGHPAQGTLVWNYPFVIAGQNFTFEGFADYTGSTGNTHPSFISQPALVWKPVPKLNLGLELQYWNNKAGRKGLRESALQAMVRWNF